MEQDGNNVVLDKPSDEDDFAGVSASFVRFEELEDDSFQEFKDEQEEKAGNTTSR